MKRLIRFGLISAVLVMMTHAQLVPPDWKAAAVKKYPELGVEGSALNRRFVEEYRQRQKTDPAFFHDQRWPLKLADELTTGPSQWRGWKTQSEFGIRAHLIPLISRSLAQEKMRENLLRLLRPAGDGFFSLEPLSSLEFAGVSRRTLSASVIMQNLFAT